MCKSKAIKILKIPLHQFIEMMYALYNNNILQGHFTETWANDAIVPVSMGHS